MNSYEIINIVLQILSIIGTFSAVVVALYLAIRKEKPRVNIISSIYHQIVPGKEGSNYLGILITNVSDIPIEIVQSFVLYVGKKGKREGKHLMINASKTLTGYISLPVTIEYGKRYDFWIDKTLAKTILSKIEHSRKYIDFGFTTTVKKQCNHRIKRSVIIEFLNS